MLKVCSLEAEYREKGEEARMYTVDELFLYGLEREKLVCALCGTNLYLYNDEYIHHYPNQPHLKEACAYAAYHNIDYDYVGCDIRVLQAKFEKLRSKSKKRTKVPAGNSNVNIPVETVPGIDGEGEDFNAILQMLTSGQGTDPENDNGPDDSENGNAIAAGPDDPENGISGTAPANTKTVDTKTTGTNPETSKDKKKKISELADFYSSGMNDFPAKKVIGEHSDGTPHFAYEEIISRKNAKYIFTNDMFPGGARVIEATLDSYCDGITYGFGQGRGTNYLVFKNSWTDGIDKDGNPIWKNVRFLLCFRNDPDFYEAFKGEYLEYDPEKRKYIPKNN